MTSNSRVLHDKKLTIGKDERGGFVTLELEIRAEGPEKTTTGQIITRKTTDMQDVTEWHELSICGSHRNGGGQMQDGIRENLDRYSLSVPREKVTRILDLWDAWHLNGMTAACVHQTGPAWDASKKIVTTQYQIEWDCLRMLERRVESDYGKQYGKPAPKGFTDDLVNLKGAGHWSGSADLLFTVRILGLKAFGWETITPEAYAMATKRVPGWNRHKFASLDDGEKKIADFINTRTQEEHPDGILSKPCPTCGYKYGSAWLVSHLPTEIEQELVTLFTSDTPVVTSESEAEDTLTTLGVKFRATKKGDICPPFCDGKHIHGDRYAITLWRGKQRLTLNFWNSHNNRENGEDPTPHDILSCLMSDRDPGSFADFCSEFGYEEDSRQAEKTYNLVKKQWAKVERFFTGEEIEQLQQLGG